MERKKENVDLKNSPIALMIAATTVKHLIFFC
jgi:hypothetical protein